MCKKELTKRLKCLNNKIDIKDLSQNFESYKAKMKKCS